MKAKKLIEILSGYPAKFDIKNQFGEDIIHIVNRDDEIILSSTKPIGICPRCGDYTYPSMNPEYRGFCPSCDEDFYAFEITPLRK